MIMGQKSRNLRLIPSQNRFLFFRERYDFGMEIEKSETHSN